MTTLPTLWRRRGWLLLWMHSASLWVAVLGFFVMRILTGNVPPLMALAFWAVPSVICAFLSPFAFVIARRKDYIPSKYVALFPMIAVALVGIIALTFFVVPILAGLGIGLGVFLAAWVMGGTALALWYSIPALWHTTRELGKREVVMLGCTQHQFETIVKAETAPDEALIKLMQDREIAP